MHNTPPLHTTISITKQTLQTTTQHTPKPQPQELLVQIKAAGINRPDILQRKGLYPPPPNTTDIPGLEIAGIVVATGSQCRRFQPGDRICALVAGGGYAQYCCVPEPQALPIPEGLDFVQAAALPETFFTVWTNLFQRARLKPGESVLIHGGASGIGTTAIQLARAFGARVMVTVRNAEKAEACRRLGAERAVIYPEEDFVAAAKDFTQGRGVEVVLDMVGGDYVPRNLEALAVEGRLVQIAWLRGSRIEADLSPLMTKRLTWTGSTLRPRSVEEKGAIARELEQKVWPLIEAGVVRPVIFATFPLERAAEAHALMESNAHIGKIVLVVDH